MNDDFADPRLGAQARRRQQPAARPYQGVFSRPGMLVRTPGGNVEDVARYKAAGVGWLLLNAEHDDWGPIPGRCLALNVEYGYWYHCRTPDDAEGLLEDARWNMNPIVGVNVEAELETTLTPQVVKDLIDASGYTGEVSLQVYGWIQNNVDMTPLADYPVMLEMFPADAPDLWDAATGTVKWADCEKHARQLGVKHPQCLMQAYRGGDPAWYANCPDPRHTYTLDDATGANGPVERWVLP